jgi:putative acetyltransferase
MVTIRPEEARDREAVRRANEAAFGRRDEADLVEALHRAGAALVSLVAEVDAAAVGHILFTPVFIEPGGPTQVAGLGPMAVVPEFQRRGIGTLLVRQGLDRCRRAGAAAAVVVGHPDYYPRFGFRPSNDFGLRCAFDVPPDVFMVMELVPQSLRGVSGLVRYHHAFSEM